MASNDPKDPPNPPAELFPFDEMSTGETSSLIRRAHALTGQPDQPVRERPQDTSLKPMTGAQLAFRPSAPPRAPGQTGSFAPLKPGQTATQPAPKTGQTGTHAAFKPGQPSAPTPRPSTGVQPAFTPTNARPATGSQPAYRPGSGSHPAHARPATGTQPAFRPTPPAAPSREPEAEDPPPVFDLERLQAQIRSMSITDSALGRVQGKVKPSKAPSSAAEDTFVKSKMKEAESKVPDFSLDEDLG